MLLFFRLNFKDERRRIIQNDGVLPVYTASYTNYMITQTLKQVSVTNLKGTVVYKSERVLLSCFLLLLFITFKK